MTVRILLVSDAASVHTQRWATSLRDLGDEVHVASFRPAEIAGVKVHLLPTFGIGRAGYLLAVPVLRRLAALLRPGVVHAHYLTSYGFVAAAARLRPLVVTAWGSDVLLSPQESAVARRLAGYALRHADEVTTVAAHMNPGVVSMGAPASKITVLPFGVDTTLFKPPAVPRPAPPPLRVLSTRNFQPLYSVHTLVEAVRQLHASGTALQLDLVGAGPLHQPLQAQVVAAGLQELTHFHGHVDHPTLAALLGRAHVYVSTAVSDGSSVSLNEAMACGCFPVVADIAANARWIEPGTNGLMFKTGDASALAACIARAATHAPLREAAALANRATVEQHANWQHTVQCMRSIYGRAMHKRGQP
jgi:glycosyltransferase involved in cell wall biosynthesis